MKPVIIWTEYRGVYFGYANDDQDLTARCMPLKGARCAIYWGTSGHVAQLAETGPTGESRIGRPADLAAVHGITHVFLVTPEAEAAWNDA